MYEKFVRDRITELRLRKGASEYQMSSDLGKCSSYMYNISSGKALPSLREVFAIAKYFGISLSEFFDTQNQYPDLISTAVKGMSRLSKEDMEALIAIIGRLCVMREAIEDMKSTDEHTEEEPQGNEAPEKVVNGKKKVPSTKK